MVIEYSFSKSIEKDFNETIMKCKNVKEFVNINKYDEIKYTKWSNGSRDKNWILTKYWPKSLVELYLCEGYSIGCLGFMGCKNLKILNIKNNNYLSEIKGEFCEHLVVINISNHGLSELPNLPETLEVLNCDNGKLTKLPDIPKSLKLLDCHSNKLTVIPDLPDGLCELNCSSNILTDIPKLPDSLKVFKCSYIDFNNLPNKFKLPNDLEEFECIDCKLKNVILPDKLKYWTVVKIHV